MRWRPGSAAPDVAEGAYLAPANLLPGFEGAALRRKREKEKRCERIGETVRKKRGRKSRGRDGKGGAEVKERLRAPYVMYIGLELNVLFI